MNLVLTASSQFTTLGQKLKQKLLKPRTSQLFHVYYYNTRTNTVKLVFAPHFLSSKHSCQMFGTNTSTAAFRCLEHHECACPHTHAHTCKFFHLFDEVATDHQVLRFVPRKLGDLLQQLKLKLRPFWAVSSLHCLNWVSGGYPIAMLLIPGNSSTLGNLFGLAAYLHSSAEARQVETRPKQPMKGQQVKNQLGGSKGHQSSDFCSKLNSSFRLPNMLVSSQVFSR